MIYDAILLKRNNYQQLFFLQYVSRNRYLILFIKLRIFYLFIIFFTVFFKTISAVLFPVHFWHPQLPGFCLFVCFYSGNFYIFFYFRSCSKKLISLHCAVQRFIFLLETVQKAEHGSANSRFRHESEACGQPSV